MFKDIYIDTEHLIIKPYNMDDLDDLYKVYS
ncbi:MAG TPA: GNAT family N-acetyltransferase, partial [Clostridiales bacterium]|nr:GNAT family N-acetyltransferase [Clostridiales bacterium]